jgi:hypothetical protein
LLLIANLWIFIKPLALIKAKISASFEDFLMLRRKIGCMLFIICMIGLVISRESLSLSSPLFSLSLSNLSKLLIFSVALWIAFQTSPLYENRQFIDSRLNTGNLIWVVNIFLIGVLATLYVTL